MINKLKKVDKSYWILIGAVIITCFIVFIMGGVFPFGNNTFGCFDFYYQVIDITGNIFNVFSGRSGLFFSFDFGNGSSFFGNIFYTCISPFTFIMLLGGRSGIRYLFPLMMMLKFIMIACVCLYFIRKYFKNIKRMWSIIFSLFYVFSGYLFMALTQPDWIDFLIYLPLVFIAFDYMKTTGKVRYLALMLALIIITSFSIGCFMILYGMLFFFFYLVLMVEKGKRAKICVKTLLAVAIAFASTLFITIPCFVEVMNSTRTGNLVENLKHMSIFRNISSKLGYLLPNIIFIVPSIVLVINNWKTKAGKFYFACIMLVLLPVLFDNINVAMNFSVYAGYNNRLGVVYNFVFLCLALKKVNTLEIKERVERKMNFIHYTTLICLLVAGIAISLAVYFVAGDALARQTTDYKAWISVLIIYIVFALIFALLFALFKMKYSARVLKIVSAVVCFVLVVSQSVMFMSACTMEIGKEKNYYKFNEIITSEDKYANVAMDLMCGQLTRGWSSISSFSSLTDKNVAKTYSCLGYSLGGHNIPSDSNNIFADMLSGIKYRISNYELNAPYLTEIERVDGAILYEYNMYLGHAYFLDNLPIFESSTSQDFIYNQNQIYKAITGDNEDLIKKKENIVLSSEGVEKDGKVLYEDCTASLNYTSEGNELLYVTVWANSCGMYYNDNKMQVGSNFIYQSNGVEQVDFEFEIKESTVIYSTCVYAINFDKLTNFYSAIIDKCVDVSYTADTISVSTQAKGKYLIVNHPSINGYSYYLNNEIVQVESFAGFIAFNINGLNDVNVLVKFTYPSVRISLIALAVGILVLIFLLVFAFNFDKLNSIFLKFILISFYVVIGIIAIYYLIFPFVVKLF